MLPLQVSWWMNDCFVDKKGAIYNPQYVGGYENIHDLQPNIWYDFFWFTGAKIKVRVDCSERAEERLKLADASFNYEIDPSNKYYKFMYNRIKSGEDYPVCWLRSNFYENV
jgi:hypothetical protein